ncbi:MAG: hypothetical protein V1765_00095 [bacterium]
MLAVQELLQSFNERLCELSNLVEKDYYLEAEGRLCEIMEELLTQNINSSLDLATQELVAKYLMRIEDIIQWITVLFEKEQEADLKDKLSKPSMPPELLPEEEYYDVFPIIKCATREEPELQSLISKDAQIDMQLIIMYQTIIDLLRLLQQKANGSS